MEHSHTTVIDVLDSPTFRTPDNGPDTLDKINPRNLLFQIYQNVVSGLRKLKHVSQSHTYRIPFALQCILLSEFYSLSDIRCEAIENIERIVLTYYILVGRLRVRILFVVIKRFRLMYTQV